MITRRVDLQELFRMFLTAWDGKYTELKQTLAAEEELGKGKKQSVIRTADGRGFSLLSG